MTDRDFGAFTRAFFLSLIVTLLGQLVAFYVSQDEDLVGQERQPAGEAAETNLSSDESLSLSLSESNHPSNMPCN